MGLKYRNFLEQANIASIYMVRFIIWFLLSIQMNETNLAMDNCIENNQVCLHSVLEKLVALLRSINPFAASYLQMHQLIQSNPAVNVKMVFMEHPDLGRYIAPTSRTEVSAIFVGDDGEPPANRDICIYPVADSYKNISPLNQCSDPMVYPLLFPNGQCGWNSNMEHVEERRSENV
ncbi:hypothetical protein AVEN_41511-1 [Araneus ventricosus]|uniref:Helitron helicase-like domain-containing protein n=1 Tax=Araneus ventricosus TaxID=182803 RepID=A0A4Y2SW27_ARAVE|nr:hypothetical protein AVEN_41511-1 [Araneus ventricosus]